MAYIRKQVFRLSQKEFARELGVNQSTVSRWEAGDLEPSRAEMERVRALAAKRELAWDDAWFFEVPATAAGDAA